MLELSIREREIIKRFFVTDGYVFNFSTPRFDSFTYHSIGVKLCERYKLSKGKSFCNFIDESNTKIIIMLVSDLLDYYEVNYDDLPDKMKKDKQVEKVKAILHDYNYLLDKVDSFNKEHNSFEHTKINADVKNLKPYDVFISHASSDKLAAVNDLRNALRAQGFEVWYDSDKILWGDKLTKVIDNGLKKCEFGIIVISRRYYNRKWCEKELRALSERDLNEGRKIILPLLLNVTLEEVIEKYPFLEDIKMIEYKKGEEKEIALLFSQVYIERIKELTNIQREAK